MRICTHTIFYDAFTPSHLNTAPPPGGAIREPAGATAHMRSIRTIYRSYLGTCSCTPHSVPISPRRTVVTSRHFSTPYLKQSIHTVYSHILVSLSPRNAGGTAHPHTRARIHTGGVHARMAVPVYKVTQEVKRHPRTRVNTKRHTDSQYHRRSPCCRVLSCLARCAQRARPSLPPSLSVHHSPRPNPSVAGGRRAYSHLLNVSTLFYMQPPLFPYLLYLTSNHFARIFLIQAGAVMFETKTKQRAGRYKGPPFISSTHSSYLLCTHSNPIPSVLFCNQADAVQFETNTCARVLLCPHPLCTPCIHTLDTPCIHIPCTFF